MSDDILCEKVEKIITQLVKVLEDKQISYFQNNPTGEISHKKEDIMVSLIDDNNQKVQCILNQDPRSGKKYIFLNRNNLHLRRITNNSTQNTYMLIMNLFYLFLFTEKYKYIFSLN